MAISTMAPMGRWMPAHFDAKVREAIENHGGSLTDRDVTPYIDLVASENHLELVREQGLRRLYRDTMLTCIARGKDGCSTFALFGISCWLDGAKGMGAIDGVFDNRIELWRGEVGVWEYGERQDG